MPAPLSLRKCLERFARHMTTAERATLLASREAAADSCSDDSAIDTRRTRRVLRWLVTVVVPRLCTRLGLDEHATTFASLADPDDVGPALDALDIDIQLLAGPIHPEHVEGATAERVQENRQIASAVWATLDAATIRVMDRSGVGPHLRIPIAQATLWPWLERLERSIIALVRAALWARWAPRMATDRPRAWLLGMADRSLTDAQRSAREQALFSELFADPSTDRDDALALLDAVIGET